MTDNTNAKMLAMQKEHGPLLEVKDLAIDFTTDTGKPVHAVRDANFTVYPGQWVAIVGESGSGKSTSAMAVLGLLPGTGHVVNGSIKLDGEEIAGAKQSEFDKLRGTRMGLVPQDPMSNLNPVWRIGTQVKEALKANNMDVDHEKRSALAKALAGDEVEVKGNDDETFLGAKELPELMTEAKKALTRSRRVRRGLRQGRRPLHQRMGSGLRNPLARGRRPHQGRRGRRSGLVPRQEVRHRLHNG